MGECMTFPDTVEEFMDSYKIVDTEHVYTNGTEMVPIFRMKQWFEHMPERKKGHWIRHPEQRNIFNGKTIECSECHENLDGSIVCKFPLKAIHITIYNAKTGGFEGVEEE